jgi:serine/threonine protein kinase
MLFTQLVATTSYSRVYRSDDGKCAVKELKPEMFRYYDAERRALSALAESKHPNVVALVGTFGANEQLYIATEWLDSTLEHRLSQPDVNLAVVTQQLLVGVRFLHDSGWVHHDIKMSNVMYAEQQCKIIDFGFSHRLRVDGRCWCNVGTPLYTAPEVYQGEYDSRLADVWSLGVLVYLVHTGVQPFPAALTLTEHIQIINAYKYNRELLLDEPGVLRLLEHMLVPVSRRQLLTSADDSTPAEVV